MTRITNVDQVMLLLQSQLQSKKKTDKKQAKGGRIEKKEVHQPPLSRVKSMAQDDVLPEGEMNRALISGLLTEEFGASVANDPAFQAIIDDVVKVISKDAESKKLLQRALAQLQSREI